MGLSPFEENRAEGMTELRLATAHAPDWGRTREALVAQPGISVEEGVARVSLVGGSAEVQRAGLRDPGRGGRRCAGRGRGHSGGAGLRAGDGELDDAVRALHRGVVHDVDFGD